MGAKAQETCVDTWQQDEDEIQSKDEPNGAVEVKGTQELFFEGAEHWASHHP